MSGRYLGAVAFGIVTGLAAAQLAAAPKSTTLTTSQPPLPTKWTAVWRTDDGRTWCPVPITSLAWQECKP